MALRKRRWFFLYLPLLTLAGVLLLFFTTGIPLTFLSGLARSPVAKMGWTFQVEKVRVRGTVDGSVLIEVMGLSLGDALASDAVTVGDIRAEWRMRRLAGLHFAPCRVSAVDCRLRVHKDGSGNPILLTPPPAKAESPSAGPLAIPPALLPVPGDALMFSLSNIVAEVPDGVAPKTFSIRLDAAGSLLRDGENLALDVESALDLDGHRFAGSFLAANLSLADMEARLSLATDVDPDAAFASVLAALPDRVSGMVHVEVEAEINLNKPDAFKGRMKVCADRIVASGAPLPEALETGPFALDADFSARTGVQGLEAASVTLRADLDEGALVAQAAASIASPDAPVEFSFDASLCRPATVLRALKMFALPAPPLCAKAGVSGEFLLKDKSLRNLDAHYAAEAFPLEIEGETYAVPACDLALSGSVTGLHRPLPDVDLRLLADVTLPGGALWENAVRLATAENGAKTRVELESRGFDLAFVTAFLPRELGLGASGRLDFSAEASGDVPGGVLESTKVVLAAPAVLEIRAEKYLKKPLAIAPFRMAAESRPGEGLLGTVAPFDIVAGPFQLHTGGIEVRRHEGVYGGKGSFDIASVTLSDLCGYLGDDFLARIPVPREEIEEFSLKSLHADLDIGGASPESLTATLAADCVLGMNRGTLGLRALAGADLGKESWTLRLDVPDFVEAGWQLGILRRLGVPELDAPLRAGVEAAGRTDGTVERASWRLEAGPGEIRLVAPLGPWKAGALPLGRFAVGGSLEKGMKSLRVDLLELKTGRASLVFSRADLESENPLIASGALKARAGIAFRMRDWYVGDFAPLLGPDFVKTLGASVEELKTVGLKSFDFSADAEIATAKEGALSIAGARSRNQAVFVLGSEEIPVDIDVNATGDRVEASAQIRGFRPDVIRLPMLERLPVALARLQFPVSLGITLSAAVPGAAPLAPKAHVHAEAGPGVVAAGPMLDADFPITFVRCDMDLSPERMELGGLKLDADFGGARLTLFSPGITLPTEAGPGRAEASLRLENWSFPWLWKLCPKAMLPAPVRALIQDMAVTGTLESLALDATFAIDPARLDPSALTQARLDALVSAVRLQLPGYPALHMARLHMGGTPEKLTAEMEDAGLDGVGLARLNLAVLAPLGDVRADVDFAARADLARLPLLIGEWRGHPAALDLPLLRSLRGTVLAEGRAGLHPLREAPQPVADLAIRYEGVSFDSPVPGITFASTSGEVRAHLENEAVSADGKGALDGLDVTGMAKGGFSFDYSMRVSREAAALRAGIDLSRTELTLDSLRWKKPAGEAAGVDFSVRAGTPLSPEVTLSWDFVLRNLIFPSVTGRGGALVEPALTGPFAPLSTFAVERLEFGVSDLALNLDARGSRVVAAVHAEKIVVPDLVMTFEDLVTSFNTRAAPGTAAPPAPAPVASAKSATAKAPPVPSAPQTPPAPLFPGLPDAQIDIAIDRVQVGPDRSLTGVTIAAKLEKGDPSGVSFHAVEGVGNNIAFAMEPGAKGRFPWRLAVDDVSALARCGVSALEVLPAEELAQGTLFNTVFVAPTSFSGGRLSVTGNFDPPGTVADTNLRLEGLVLRQNVPFLSKIAALVNKRVVLAIPFSRFDLEGMRLSAESFHMAKGFVDGPIDLGIETVDVSFAEASLMMRGRVFGICFEVVGPLSSPQFFLCENNKVIESLTQEDDFEW
jgi:hypothetical protein